MSLRQTLKYLSEVADWVVVARDQFGKTEFSDQLIQAPLPDIGALSHGDFWHVQNAIEDLSEWLKGFDLEDVTRMSHEMARKTPYSSITNAIDTLNATLPFYEDRGDGMLTPVPHDAPANDFPRYHSLANAALTAGYSVSVFDHPIKAENLYDGKIALEVRYQNAPIVGQASSYKVVVLDGELHHPPLWPSEIQKASCDQEEDFSPSLF